MTRFLSRLRRLLVAILRETTIGDRILVTLLLVSSIGGSLFISLASAGGNDKKVVIKVANEVVEKFSINKDTDTTYSFKFGNNTGYIEVKDGAVRMREMPKNICPQKICSDIGWISTKYQTIVCLPNKIVVSIEQVQEAIVDAVSF